MITQVASEIGKLQGVILHTPGHEVENMTPANAERALYSDILNLSIVSQEYKQLIEILNRSATVFQVKEMLRDVLNDASVKSLLVREICQTENTLEYQNELLGLGPEDLASALIEGYLLQKNTLTKYLSQETYALLPLPNFFFTRDSSMSVFDSVFIGNMASTVREREALIMQSIFRHHPTFSTKVISAKQDNFIQIPLTFEGGDILIAREDILVVGISKRTSSQGIDFILNQLKKNREKLHVIVQEMPAKPESFIHLDMTFTLLDVDKCMVFEPLILKQNRYQTVHIIIEGGEVKHIRPVTNILSGLASLGMDLEPIYCGGKKDIVIQEREQWHSGANFFATAPGQVIGYSRNVYTTEEMNKAGFEIVKASDIINGKVSEQEYSKYLITIDGSELSRGGGGPRCMTMPVSRKPVTP